jgi:hypothetical protein
MFELVSVLRRVDEIKVERLDGIKKDSQKKLEEVARRDLPTARLVCRDLLPTDLGLTNNEWTETTGATDNAWDDTSIASQSIKDDTYVAIYGCRLLTLAANPPISALKIQVGGATKAIWDLYKIWPLYTVGGGTAAAERTSIHSIAGIAETPVIITRNMQITIAEYVIEASTAYKLAFEGLVVEKEGVNLTA